MDADARHSTPQGLRRRLHLRSARP